MRIALFVKSDVAANAQYRALMLVNVLRERGHEIAWYGSERDRVALSVLQRCDVIHMYRLVPPNLLRTLRRLQLEGVALTWDNDDDVLAIDRRSPNYAMVGGAIGVRDFAVQARMVRQADAVTTTSAALAERFRRAGGSHVHVIENYLPREFVDVKRRLHRGVVIGWVAAAEHVVDAQELGVADVLQGVMQSKQNVRIVTVGAPLPVSHPRYEHWGVVPFTELTNTMARFDIGIAPMANIPFNRARSNIKLKEYAAAGTPWLGSAVGEYSRLGPAQGGWLVPDDAWRDTLLRLVAKPLERAMLSRRGRRWARRQTLRSNVHRWEEVFEEAIERARRRGARARRPSGTSRPRARRR